ncbi:tRNA uridine-5-carboxymethylaminomethyl(34) synthesis GTPase MnmE [Rhodobacteraceae bacterium XHP0102]|nr:tRNA uridine-5-carboxymethylaminomethyl(34) synthesis GTPase MnmE [Rhodobacteraceae bacterium XHP0102]
MSAAAGDTIFAQASGTGRAGVSVIRVSGPDAFAICANHIDVLPKAGQFKLRYFQADGQNIDHLLVLTFRSPNSFTGEDVVELHCHGSPAVVKAILAVLTRYPQARPAEPGEFTRRALENNKLDLAQVEGLSDLINAETEAQRMQAVRIFSGQLGILVESWRQNLLRAAALIEVTIDFADEDVPVDVSPEVSALMAQVMKGLSTEIAGSYVAERVRNGFEVAIIGAPNAGKSTLLNTISGRDVAITSEVAGTTRDVIEVRMDVNGLPVTLLDTAGIRDSADEIEKVGVQRAIERAQQADLRVFLKSTLDEEPPFALSQDDISLLGKGDLHVAQDSTISGKSGDGVDRLLAQIAEILSARAANVGTATHLRHRHAMEAACEALDQARSVLDQNPASAEIAAEYLRYAIRKLDSLIGRVDVEMVLGEIFSQFCLGK